MTICVQVKFGTVVSLLNCNVILLSFSGACRIFNEGVGVEALSRILTSVLLLILNKQNAIDYCIS